MSPDFKKKWEDNLTNCSLNLTFLINEHKNELGKMDCELNALLQGVATLQNTDSFANREKDLQENLKRFSREIITTKEMKIIRDRKAFKLNKAYKWPMFQQSRPFKYPNPPKQRSNSTSKDTVVSDSSTFPQFSHFALPNSTPRFSQKRSQGDDVLNRTQDTKRCADSEHQCDFPTNEVVGIGDNTRGVFSSLSSASVSGSQVSVSTNSKNLHNSFLGANATQSTMLPHLQKHNLGKKTHKH